MIIVYALGLLLGVIGAYLLLLLVCALLVNPQKDYEKCSPLYRWLLDSATAVALRVSRVRVHVEGLEKIPQDTKKLLFVSNHRSNYDPIVTWYALKKWRLAFISKEENFHIPIFGRLIRKCGFMAIDREDPRKAIVTIQKAARLLEQGEVSVGVYPEGTRSKNCQLLPFHNGVFKIAQKAKAPVVVLAVQGTEQVHKNYPFHRTDVYVEVLDVIDGETVASSATAETGEKVRALLAQHLQQEVAV